MPRPRQSMRSLPGMRLFPGNRKGPGPVLLLLILAVHLAIVLPTVTRQGVNWDERTDLDIAETYSGSFHGLFAGSTDDLVNTRLPMFSAGLLFRLVHADHLLLARLLSVVVALATIAGVFLYGRNELDQTKALVACLILATSPYFLFFGKQALTEGDIWITCAVIWFLVAIAGHLRVRTHLSAAAVGLMLGLAVSAKVSGLALVPILVLLIPESADARRSRDEGATTASPGSVGLPSALAALLLLALANALAAIAVSPDMGLSASVSETYPLLRLAGLGLLTLFVLRWLVVRRHTRTSRMQSLGVVVLVAGLAFFLIPPVHTTNPRILGALGSELLRSGSGPDWGFIADAALLHFSVITLKNSLGVGVGLWIGLCTAMMRRGSRRRLGPGLLALALYGAFILLLPWAQIRYVMPLVPILALCAADALVDLFRRRRNLAIALGFVAVSFLVADYRYCYPDLNLNGYFWVGQRYLGERSTIGYRSIVHTPSDGIEQALRWVGAEALPRETVVTVFGERHITRSVLPDPEFRIASLLHEPVSLADADWVVTSINYDIEAKRPTTGSQNSVFSYPEYDRAELEREFTRVFSVERRFRIEVAAVWKRVVPAERAVN